MKRTWTKAQLRVLRQLYPGILTAKLGKRFGRPRHQIYAKAKRMGLAKNASFFARMESGRLHSGSTVGLCGRFYKGHVPANKGLRRPGWGPGRMKETQFKQGQI